MSLCVNSLSLKWLKQDLCADPELYNPLGTYTDKDSGMANPIRKRAKKAPLTVRKAPSLKGVRKPGRLGGEKVGRKKRR
jgi:hypothetical protein